MKNKNFNKYYNVELEMLQYKLHTIYIALENNGNIKNVVLVNDSVLHFCTA